MAIFDKSQSDHLAVIDSAFNFPDRLAFRALSGADVYAEKADAAARNALGM